MYVERRPGPALADRVACGWHRISDEAFTQLVVPDACVDLIWSSSGLYVAGPDTGPMPSPVGPDEMLVGVRFRPGAVGGFFGVSLLELRDQRVPLSDLPGRFSLLSEPTDRPIPAPTPTRATAPGPVGADRAHHSLEAQGAEISEHASGRAGMAERVVEAEARLHILQAAVEARLAFNSTTDPGLDPAAPAIASALGQGKTVAQVAWDLGYSERQLQRRSVTSFGYAPKTLQRIVRFQRALRLARAGVPLAEVAARAGYTDQAHLANDVKRLSGVQMSRLVPSATG